MPAAGGQPFPVRTKREETKLVWFATHVGTSHLPHPFRFESAEMIAVKGCEDLAILRKAGLLPRPRRADGCRRTDAEFARPACGPDGPQRQPALAAYQQAAAAFLKAQACRRPGRQGGEQTACPRIEQLHKIARAEGEPPSVGTECDDFGPLVLFGGVPASRLAPVGKGQQFERSVTIA